MTSHYQTTMQHTIALLAALGPRPLPGDFAWNSPPMHTLFPHHSARKGYPSRCMSSGEMVEKPNMGQLLCLGAARFLSFLVPPALLGGQGHNEKSPRRLFYQTPAKKMTVSCRSPRKSQPMPRKAITSNKPCHERLC